MPKNESGEGLENQSDFETQIANLKLQVPRECGKCPKKPICRIWKKADGLRAALEGLNSGDQKDMFQEDPPLSANMVILITAHACRAFNG
tara:strand:- start:164 stop:433 length:270 start_codon:yes stop_codon:yes gene_type:complete